MKKNSVLIVLMLFALSAQAQKKIEAIVIGQRVVRTQDSREIVARFYKNDAGDTVTIDMTEFIPLQKSLPKIAQNLGIEKNKTTILKVVEPDNTITYQTLNILAPDIAKARDSTSYSPISLGYSIGRHTDQFNVNLRYYKSFGVGFHLGTSIYRGDLNSHFLFIGLYNDFQSIFGTEWGGVFSAGAMGIVFYDKEGMITGPVGIIKIQRPYAKNLFFGPKFIFGAHNEVGFSISTRL
tara:strand:+ start:8934 stop:9644 length:711 start_codon:yes stop_codon:yes gene_type:complete